jgi:hypothetical protein
MRTITFIRALAGVVVIAIAAALPVAAQTDVLNVVNNKVGVLTASPTAPLHVVKSPAGGTAMLVQEGAQEVKRTDGGMANVRFKVDNATITQSWLFMLNGSNGTFEIRNETGSATPFGIRANAPVNSFVATATGVGIGTGSPAGKLDVNGSIYQRGGQIHADYVFEPGYELESIDEHALRMWGERHLPAVPPRQVDGEGREIVEIGSHQRGILEELEKAHIYIEQLHRRLEDQDRQFEELSERFSALETALTQ